MAFQVKVKIEGVEEALASLRGMKASVRNRALRTGVTKVSRRVVNVAKSKIDKRTGLLRKSMGFKVKTYKGKAVVVGIIGPRKGFRQTITLPDGSTEIHDPAKIAHFIEKGRRAVSVKTAKVLSNGKVFFGRRVASFPARPFLRPALDTTKGQARNIIAEEVSKALVKHGG